MKEYNHIFKSNELFLNFLHYEVTPPYRTILALFDEKYEITQCKTKQLKIN